LERLPTVVFIAWQPRSPSPRLAEVVAALSYRRRCNERSPHFHRSSPTPPGCMTSIGPADRALLENLCRLTALAAEPWLRQVPRRRHADSEANDAVVHEKAMDFALDALGALLRDIRAKAMAAAAPTATLPAVRLSSVDELLGPELLEAARPYGLAAVQLRSVLLRVLGDLVEQTDPAEADIALPLSLSLDREATARLIQA